MTSSTDSKTQTPWYREVAMMIVIGVLVSTVVMSGVIITLAVNSDDPLVISDEEYQQLRDDLRGTKARESDEDE